MPYFIPYITQLPPTVMVFTILTLYSELYKKYLYLVLNSAWKPDSPILFTKYNPALNSNIGHFSFDLLFNEATFLAF